MPGAGRCALPTRRLSGGGGGEGEGEGDGEGHMRAGAGPEQVRSCVVLLGFLLAFCLGTKRLDGDKVAEQAGESSVLGAGCFRD